MVNSGFIDAWSFRCSACGRCCNSSPLLSVPELFRHQHLFIGVLTVRRVKRPKPGERYLGVTIGAEECAAAAELAETLLLQTEESLRQGFDFFLAVQGFDPLPGRCPALGEDGRCDIHRRGKPATCSAVPLEPLVTDRLQSKVLRGRSADRVGLGSGCIVAGERPGVAALTGEGGVTDAGMRSALSRRRSDLAAERRWWGGAVFRMLERELFADPAAVARIPFDGFLAVSPAPVVLALAEGSPRCRERSLEFLDAQAALIEETIARVRGTCDPEVLRQLRGFLRAGDALRSGLRTYPAAGRAGGNAATIEAWLGLDAYGKEPSDDLQ